MSSLFVVIPYDTVHIMAKINALSWPLLSRLAMRSQVMSSAVNSIKEHIINNRKVKTQKAACANAWLEHVVRCQRVPEHKRMGDQGRGRSPPRDGGGRDRSRSRERGGHGGGNAGGGGFGGPGPGPGSGGGGGREVGREGTVRVGGVVALVGGALVEAKSPAWKMTRVTDA